ncbi:MAG: DeoR/GlpR family DNA-binding transcription regulator [Lachnospiraceae bacterium]
MVPYERRKEILQLLDQKEIVSLEEFCELLQDVSSSTIRRDLKVLESEGHIELLRGGAAKLKGGYYDTPVESRTQLNVEEKEIIAKYAANMVQDGDVVYIDSGSTTLLMVKYLVKKRITIVTTNTDIPIELKNSEIECIMVGGKINVKTASLYGGLTDHILQGLHFDKAFLGASGFSKKAGINTPDLNESNKKQLIKQNSRKVYILADSSKDGKTSMCKIFELGEVTIICDCETPDLIEGENYIIAKF